MIIKDKIAGPGGCCHFHTNPYRLHWQPANLTIPIRVQGELYTSPAFIDAHQELQDLPGEPGCDLPQVIAALMFWSNSPCLTSFGKAKLWPLYLYFSNNSKYRRCKPSCHLWCQFLLCLCSTGARQGFNFKQFHGDHLVLNRPYRFFIS